MSAPVLLATGVASLAIGVALSDGLRAAAGNVPILAGVLSGLSGSPFPSRPSTLTADQLPAQALLMLPSQYAALDSVLPPDQANATTIFVPPGLTLQEMLDKPFHVYHEDFLHIIGKNPTLTLIADSGTDPVFHEANVWYPPTDEVFFVQSSGNPKTGTGLHKSAIIQKVSVPQAMAVASTRNAVGEVDVIKVDSQPQVINPNGATNFEGNLIFTGEGMGDKIAPTLFVMNPVPPYNTSILVNNYYGRQFNSLNDVSVNIVTKQIYFTDVTYGERQAFRPKPRLPNQVYTINPVTKAVSVVADGFDSCNGITISPDGKYAYVTDTGANQAFYGYNDHWRPATIYRFTIAKDGTFEDRKVFAHITMGVPDGVHCDSEGNVYSGCDDGVHVWNPSGLLIGKIFTGDVSPNFQFAGNGRMVICAETHLYYAGLAAKAAPIA